MNNIINEQINLVLEEIEMIGDSYQRADIRVKLITALTNFAILPIENEPTGKDALKNDTKKEIVEEPTVNTESKKDKNKKETKKSKKEKDSQKVEVDKADEAPITFEPVDQTEVIEDPQPKEIDLEPEAKEETTEPIVIECEDEEGNPYTLDITEAWNIVGDEEGSEERVELAKNLTEYNLLPIYNTLEKLDHSYNKMMLSYYMQEYGLDAINEFISDLTEGLYSDVYEFVNNENLDGLITNIESAEEE